MIFDSQSGILNLLFQFLITVATLVGLIALYLVYQLYFKPKQHMKFYTDQGLPSLYYPVLGRLVKIREGKEKYGDSQHFSKHKAREDPNRAYVSNIGAGVSIILNDPILVKEFYINHENYVKDPLVVDMYRPILGKGLLTSEGSQWKTQRKILSNAFHFEFLKQVLPSIQGTTHQNLLSLQEGSLKNINIMDEFQRTTGEVVGKIFFGEQLNEYQLDGKPLTLALADLMISLARASSPFVRFLFGPKFIQKGYLEKHRKVMQRVKAFRDVCSKIVKTGKAEQGKKTKTEGLNMLDLLLNYEGEEGKMDDEEIIDQFVSFFLAGMDTTGHLVTMVVYYLHKHPEYRARIEEEVRKFYRLNEQVTIEDLNKLEFLMAFTKETLRLMTPVPTVFPRKAVRDHKLKDLTIKKGDRVMLDFFYNNYNPNYFEDPDTFNPNRWFEKEKSIEAYAFTPFSAGPRNCIGQHLSLIEARIIIAEFLMLYDFKLKDDYQLKMGFKFLYEPVEEIKVDLTKREP